MNEEEEIILLYLTQSCKISEFRQIDTCIKMGMRMRISENIKLICCMYACLCFGALVRLFLDLKSIQAI